jgi:hypothetical protein
MHPLSNEGNICIICRYAKIAGRHCRRLHASWRARAELWKNALAGRFRMFRKRLTISAFTPVQRTDPHRVACSDILTCAFVVKHARENPVEAIQHLIADFTILHVPVPQEFGITPAHELGTGKFIGALRFVVIDLRVTVCAQQR